MKNGTVTFENRINEYWILELLPYLRNSLWTSGVCTPPPPPGSGGRAHSLAGRTVGGGSQFLRGDIHCGTLGICVLCAVSHQRLLLKNLHLLCPQICSCQLLLGEGHKWDEIVSGEEKIFFMRRLEPGQDIISCTGKTSPPNQPKKDSFHMYSWSPHLPRFQQSSGATPH